MRLTIIALLALAACGGGSEASAPTPTASTAPAAPSTEAVAEAAPPAGGTATGDAAAGKTVYDTYCTACHQADGTGMNGMLAANFVADPTRLAKPDAELLTSIRDGKTGTVGTMPPWGTTLSEQQQHDVLAYVRATFQK